MQLKSILSIILFLVLLKPTVAQEEVLLFVQGNELLSFDTSDCSYTTINSYTISFTDIALYTDGTLYGIRSNGTIYEINEENGTAQLVHEISSGNTIYTALASSVNGFLYAGELDGDIITYNPTTNTENYLGNINFNIEGDLSFRDGQLYAGSSNGIVTVNEEAPESSFLLPWVTSPALWGLNTDYIDCDTQYTYAITGENSPSIVYLADHFNETFTEVCQINRLVYGSTSRDELLASSTIDIELTITQPDCDQSELVAITILEGQDLEFSLNDGPYSTTTEYANLLIGENRIHVIDQLGCDEEYFFTIENYTEFDVEITSSDATCDSFGFLSIEIIQGDNLQFTLNDEIINDSFLYLEELGDYTLIVSDDNGCTENFDFTIDDTCTIEEDTIEIAVPNVFAPNGNTINDRFTLLAPDDIPVTIKEYQLYNRWGNLLYSSSNFLNTNNALFWDGTINDDLLYEGIFLYYISYEYLGVRDEVIEGSLSGTGLLIR